MSRTRDIANILGKTENANTGNEALLNTASDVGSSLSVYSTLDDLPSSGLTSGDQAFVSSTSRFYISNGSGWYNVALINATPTLTIDPAGAVALAVDGVTPTVITLTATDSDVKAERGGTATTKVMQLMTRKTEEFARIAGIPLKEFEDLVNNNIFEALLKVSEAVQGNADKATEFGVVLEELQLTGSGASEVFTKMGVNADFLREKALLATQALSGTESIMDEFNVKNENLAATVDKLGKSWNSFTSSTAVQNFAKTTVSVLKETVTWFEANAEWLIKIGNLIGKFGVAWLATMAIIKAKNSIQAISLRLGKSEVASIFRRTKALKGMNAIQARTILLTRSFTRSLKQVKAALASSGVGLLVIGLTELYNVLQKTSVAAERTKTVFEGIAELNKNKGAGFDIQAQKVNGLVSALNQSNISLKAQNQLLSEYNELTGQDVQNSKNRMKFLNELNASRNRYLDSLKADSDVKAIETRIEFFKDQVGEIDAEMQELAKKYLSANDLGFDFDILQNKLTTIFASTGMMDTFAEQLKKLADLRKKLLTDIEKEKNAIAPAIVAKAKTRTVLNNSPTNESAKNRAKIGEESLNKIRSFHEAFLKILADSEDKVLQVERANYNSKLKYLDLELKLLDDKYTKIEQLAIESSKKAVDQAERDQENLLKKLEEMRDKNLISESDYAAEKRNIEEGFANWKIRTERELQSALFNFSRARYEEEKQARISAAAEALKEIERLENNDTISTTAIDKIRRSFNAQRDELFKLQSKLINQAGDNEELKEEIDQAIADELENNKSEERRAVVAQRVNEWQTYVDMAKPILQGFFDWKANAEEKDFRRYKTQKSGELNVLDAALKSGQITQEKYDARRLKIEEDLRAKEAKIRRKQFQRNQRAAFIESLINGALAITKTLATVPPPASYVMASITGAATAIQSAAILSSPVPEFGRGTKFTDKVLQGPSHESISRGMPIINPKTNKVVARVEGGEVLLSKRTYENNRELIDPLLDSSLNRSGARLDSSLLYSIYSNQSVPSVNFERTTKAVQFSEAPVFSQPIFSSSNISSEDEAAKNELQERTLNVLLKIEKNQVEIMGALKNGEIKSGDVVIPLTEIKEKELELVKLEALAKFNQKSTNVGN